MTDLATVGQPAPSKTAATSAPSSFMSGLRAPMAGLRPPTAADILLGTGALHYEASPQGETFGAHKSPAPTGVGKSVASGVAAGAVAGASKGPAGGFAGAGASAGVEAGSGKGLGAAAGAVVGAAAGVGKQLANGASALPDDGKYHSGYTGAFMSGIQNTSVDARKYDREVNGNGDGFGYGVYAPSPHDQQVDINTELDAGWFGKHKIGTQMNLPMSGLDAVSDIAAVTQYAAAADQAIKMEKGPDGKPTVNIDWAKLHNTPVQSNLQFDHNGKPIGGSQKITYDSPGAMADQGAQSIMDNMKANGKDPTDKSQFVAITGHSGGGQSSFYTALKMASDGYKNVSVVGVDMAMTPAERKILESMGVNVTNITSNSKDDKGSHTSEIGEFIKIGMGGTDNYYDLNVERQGADALAKGGQKPADMLGRHGIDNDANVATMVRFAQYQDANGKHGQLSSDEYNKFLASTKHADELQIEGKTPAENKTLTADTNLMSKVEDNRGKTGGAHQTEADFQKWFSGFVDQAGMQMLPVPDQISLGPLHYNAKEDLSKRLSELAANNSPGMVQMLQKMGVDTTHIQGLEKYNSTSISNHWGQFNNNVEVPLPDWLNIDAVPQTNSGGGGGSSGGGGGGGSSW